MIPITPTLSLGDHEVQWSFTRSSGAGGQHVNRTESAAVLEFHIPSSSLPAAVKARLLAKRDHRLGESGVFTVKAQEHRSQAQNREAALARLAEFIRSGLHAPRPRVATRPSRGSKERRLVGKQKRGSVKATRRRPDAE